MQLWLKYGVDACLHAHRTHTQQEQQSGQQLMASPTAVWLAMAPSSSTVPGSPADQATKLRGPWLQTQLAIAALVGVTSFLSFCFFRTRSKVLYMPRTLLKGFSPHEVHSKASFFGWILPTLRTSEFTVLQIVGLDAVVLLSFFKTSFYFFGICTLLAAVALVPINYRENGTSEGVPPPAPDPDDESLLLFTVLFKRDTYHGSTLYLTSHLIFTYLFSILALFMLYRAYRAFIHTRQLFSLDHALSIPARTVLITSLPHHLRSERVLAQYWEDMGLKVESVSVGRNVGSLQNLLEDRTTKLLALETAWMKYVGNPVSKEALQSGYDRDALTREIIFDEDGRPEGAARGYNVRMSEDDLLAGTSDIVLPTTPAPEDTTEQSDLEAPPVGTKDHFEIANKKRPTHRPRLITNEKVDLLDHLARQYRTADEAVKRRRKGRFRPANIAFVTFEDIGSAQIAAQVVHYPQPDSVNTTLAPDPRDIYWGNMLLSNASLQARNILVLGAMLLLLSFWLVPVSALARLLNYDAIKKYLPWLTKILDKSPRLRVFVQNTLPTTAVISFNALLPFLLEWLCILQGLRSRSEIEYSLLKKYHIFLIINVVLVFIAVSTWDLAKQFANEPMKLVNKLALSLPGARNFFLSYVILQGIGIMPLQLVQLSAILPRWLYRLIWTRTPRDFAELNTPPAISLGTIYPQALLIFLICLTYSVITPLILLFGTIYFGMGYLVYKYKLLFIYFRPYESRGQAWPISFVRMCWGLLIFQLFMTGLFALREAALLTLLMFPLLIFTLYTSWSLHTRFHALSKYVNLAQAAEVKRTQDNGTTYEAGALASDVERLRKGHPVTMSQSNLNRGRYRSKDERDDGLYIVKQDSKTDYIQPPMSQSFYGVLSNDRKRYNHPAISGRLPVPWLPAGKKDYLQSVHSILPSSSEIENIQPDLDIDLSSSGAVLIDLKRRFTDFRNMTKRMAVKTAGGQLPPPSDDRSTGRHGRPASRRDRSGSDCADPSFHNDAAMQNTASIWGAPTNLLSKSPASTSGRSQDDAGDSSEDEEDEEAGQRDRYTYYPHKRSSSTGSNASHLPEDEESGGNETDH